MHLQGITELVAVGVLDAGVPQLERIVLRPTQPVNLAQFAIMITVQSSEFMTPLADYFFWLGEEVISPPSWVVLFTGGGEDRNEIGADGSSVYTRYWGRQTVLFVPNGMITPTIVRLAAVQVVPYLPSVTATPKPAASPVRRLIMPK